MDKLPLAYVRAIVDANWAHLLHVTQYSHDTDRLVDRCLATEERAEREHRRGKYSRTGYRGTATTVARSFVLQHVWTAEPTKTIASIAGVAERVMLAYSLSALMREHRVPLNNKPGPTMWEAFTARVTRQAVASPGLPVSGRVSDLAIAPDHYACVTRGYTPDAFDSLPLFMAVDYSRDFTG